MLVRQSALFLVVVLFGPFELTECSSHLLEDSQKLVAVTLGSPLAPCPRSLFLPAVAHARAPDPTEAAEISHQLSLQHSLAICSVPFFSCRSQ